MAQIVEGLWDCPYCGQKGIGGLKKHCPNCGHPQDKGTKFYMGTQIHVLSEDEANNVGTNPDWVCSYCGSYNNYKYIYCSNCGASKDENDGDYFTQKNAPAQKGARVNPSPYYEERPSYIPPQKEKKTPSFKMPKLGIIALIIVLVLGIIAVMPQSKAGKVDSKSWERNIQVEEYGTVRESDWSVPQGGRVVEKKQEIKSYRDVLDHYETKTRTVSESVQDGYDTEYEDNGNGTFTAVSVPRYRTEYRTETYEEPVYRKEPVYATKYYYDIDKWHYQRTETSNGLKDEPYWPMVVYEDNQREMSRDEQYTIVCLDTKKDKTYPYNCELLEWERYNVGDSIEFTLQMGSVTKIKEK